MDRQDYEAWAQQGETRMGDRVVEKTRKIIAEFEGPISKVPAEAQKKIAEILKAAEARETEKAKAKK